SARGRFCFRPCLPDSKKSSRHAARRCASTPTSRDTSSKDSPRNSRNTTSILRFADHLGFDRKSPASSLDTDMSTMLAPLYRLSNDSGCGGVLACRSGLGDGVYPVWRGDSADGVSVAVELQFLPLGDEPFVTVGSFTVSGPFVVSDPAYVGFGAGLTTSVDWLPAGEYLVQVAVQELEFWGRRVSAVSLVSPVS